MIATTAEVINRVYPVMKQNNPKEILGTVFSIREKEKEFLITAYHVAEHAIEKNTNKVGLIIGTIPLGTRIYEKIIYIDEELDIIILEAPKWMHIGQLSLTSTPEMILGQDVMWMGYPDGWSGGQLLGKTHTPTAIAGKGVIGGFPRSSNKTTKNVETIIIEGRISGGYSGGPVVLKDTKTPYKTHVIGMITGHIFSLRKLKQEQKQLIYPPSFILATYLNPIMKEVHEKLNH